MKKQYHVLVSGFEINRGKDRDRNTTDLRHYRFDVDTFTLSNEGGAWSVRQGKELKASFPVQNTMILVEEVEDK